MITTIVGKPINDELLLNYLESLINRFFKILPIRESGEETLATYMRSLQSELIGCEKVIVELNNDASILSLISILQFLIDNPDYPIPYVKSEVFKAIRLCNKLKTQFEKAV